MCGPADTVTIDAADHVYSHLFTQFRHFRSIGSILVFRGRLPAEQIDRGDPPHAGDFVEQVDRGASP